MGVKKMQAVRTVPNGVNSWLDCCSRELTGGNQHQQKKVLWALKRFVEVAAIGHKHGRVAARLQTILTFGKCGKFGLHRADGKARSPSSFNRQPLNARVASEIRGRT